jgi:hypothetical protein
LVTILMIVAAIAAIAVLSFMEQLGGLIGWANANFDDLLASRES